MFLVTGVTKYYQPNPQVGVREGVNCHSRTVVSYIIPTDLTGRTKHPPLHQFESLKY
jgi:hypothetical protein